LRRQQDALKIESRTNPAFSGDLGSGLALRFNTFYFDVKYFLNPLGNLILLGDIL
jgi:hypothetical protein